MYRFGTNRPKYGNKKCVFGGITFDSKLEMQRYMFLKDAEGRGEITSLKLQDRLELLPQVWMDIQVQLKTKVKTERRELFKKTEYVADFTYYKDGKFIVEDTKGFQTDIFKLKAKLFYHKYGFCIRTVKIATEEI